MSAPTPNWADRIDAVRRFCASQNLDVFVVSNPVNVTYLTGFAGSSGLLVCGRDEPGLVVDGRYEAIVRQRLAAGLLAQVRLERVEKGYDQTLAALIRAAGSSRAGFDAGHVTVATLARWQTLTPGCEWQPTEGVVERLRCRKDAFEVAVFRRAGGLLAGVAREIGSWVARGKSERAIAADVNRALGEAGFSGPAFPTIVASGPNSAYPHARPTDRHVEEGDLVVLDFGGVLDGYSVDLTRVISVGQVRPAIASLYEAVLDAQSAAIETIRAGVLGADVDRAARRVLEARGLGAAFLHGTGHGLGLEVHEAPRIARADSGASEILEAGMVCTIEPGAYVEGLGGVRLEDDVLVTADGCEVLTDAPRDLLVV